MKKAAYSAQLEILLEELCVEGWSKRRRVAPVGEPWARHAQYI